MDTAFFRRCRIGVLAVSLAALFACACSLGVGKAWAYDVGESFIQDGLTYTITGDATVRLRGAAASVQGSLSVPSSVKGEGVTYQVTAIAAGAFSNAADVTSLYIPAAATFEDVPTYLQNCTNMESFTVEEGNTSVSSEDGVLYNADKTLLVSYPQKKEGSSFTVPASVRAINAYGFYASSLSSIEFAGSSLSGLSSSGQLLTSTGFAVGSYAFAYCTNLTSISLPAIVSATRKGDYYQAYSTQVGDFTSGYMAYWHNDSGPVSRAGIGSHAFYNCSALETVDFQAGNDCGMFAYYTSPSSIFLHCDSLKTLVFQDKQAYWSDPCRSYRNGTYTDCWENAGISQPNMYYAVRYYASGQAAEEGSVSNALASVEFLRGTSTAAICSSNADELAESLYDSAAVLPDAATAAGHAGEEGWCWALDRSQGSYDTLLDSCCAYPVKEDCLEYGRVLSSQSSAVRTLALRHLGTAFEPDRYENDADSKYAAVFNNDSTYLESGETCWYQMYGSWLDLSNMQVCTAGGTVVDSSMLSVSYQRYSNGALGAAQSTISEAGMYLATFTPTAESGLDTSSSLTQWVLVKAYAGTVEESYGASAANTSYNADRALSATSGTNYGDVPFVLVVGNGDATSGLIAAGFAGMANTGIQVTASASSLGSASMVKSAVANTTRKRALVIGNVSKVGSAVQATLSDTLKCDVLRFGSTTATDIDAATLAAKSYTTFNSKKSTYVGAGNVDSYTWGSTAVLVNASKVADVSAIAAYAYANKAPVFFLESDGTVSTTTWNCLKDFSTVVLAGDTSVIPAAVETSLAQRAASSGLSLQVSRLAAGAGDVCGFSLAVAQALLDQDGAADRPDAATRASVVAVCDARDSLDAVGALNLTGYNQGLTLVSASVADSKRIAAFLYANRDHVGLVHMFGRNASVVSSSSFNLATVLGGIWSATDASMTKACALAAGDTVAPYGVQTKLVGTSTLQLTGSRVYGTATLAVGSTYSYNGTAYNVAAAPIVKKAQKLTVSTTAKKVKYSKVKKKKQVTSKVVVKGTAIKQVRYTKVAKGSSAKLTINKTTGKITVKKGTKKGTYKIKVKVTAASSSVYYNAPAAVTKTIKVKVVK